MDTHAPRAAMQFYVRQSHVYITALSHDVTTCMAAACDNIMRHVHRLLSCTVYRALHMHILYYVVAVCNMHHNYALAPSITMATT